MSRILYCHTSASGGAELAAPALASQLQMQLWIRGDGTIASEARSRSVPVTILPERTDKRAKSLWSLLASLLELVRVQFEVYRSLRSSRPSVLVSNSVQGLLHVALPAAFTRTPLIAYVRDLGAGGNRPSGETLVYNILLRLFCRAAIFNSSLTKASWCFRRSSIVVPTAVSDDFFDVWSGTDDYSVVMIGRLAAWKGQAQALMALDLLRPNIPVTLEIVGASLFEDAAELPPTTVPISATNHVPDPWNNLRRPSLLVHASITPEPFGQVLAQAAAAGIPIVCSDKGGHLGWLIHGKSCMTADPHDTEAFASAIEYALTDRATARSRAAVARSHAEMFKEGRAYEALNNWIRNFDGEKE